MKRTAADAFSPAVVSADIAAAASGFFQPSKNAMLDPKAYFAQFQQAAMQGKALAAPGTVAVAPAAASTAPAPGADAKTEIQQQVESASAIRCANLVKDKGANFTTVVAIAALSTMATKSSYKLREELLGQPAVKNLCERVRNTLSSPPAGLGLELLTKAAWCLTRFPDEVMGAKAETLGSLARQLASADPNTGWSANTASKVLWCLTKADVITAHKALVTQVLKELLRDKARRVPELSHEEMVNMLTTIAKSRVHLTKRKGENQTVRLEANDELYFELASKRICAEAMKMDVRVVAEVAHVHAEAGIRDEKLFKAICPRIMEKSKDLDTKTMAKCIKAYARFMIPLREEAQGFRTMAVVAKGDFIRPSDKPKKTGPKTYDQPIPLYAKTQLHSRG